MIGSVNCGKKKWYALMCHGKQVKLFGDYKASEIGTYETEERAQEVLRQLHEWSKEEREDREYKSLCQAGD